ncbi:hypothetical protein ACO0OE_001183 [Hanseniaspora uvarum]
MSEDNKDSFTTASKGYFTRKPQKIHVAHRRSPSELTSLMIEQLNLGEDNSQSGGSNNSSFLPPPPTVTVHQSPGRNNVSGNGGYHSRNQSESKPDNTMSPGNFQNSPRSHSRTGSYSGGHSRTNSGHAGHNRRQSLQLNEAKKHALEEQTKRGVVISGNGSAGSSPDVANGNISTNDDYTFPRSSSKGISRNSSVNSRSFKFPQTNISNNDSNDYNNDFMTSPRKFKFGSGGSFGHSRNNSTNNSNNLSSKFQHTPSNSESMGQPGTTGLLEPFSHKQNSQSVSSIQAFNANSSANANVSANATAANQRKSLFAPYLPQSNIPKLIEEGRLVVGTLRVNKKNRSDAWVSTDGILDADIYICGSKDRNRALENDLVAVELLCVDDVWGNKKEKEEKKRRKDLGNNQDMVDGDYHNDATINQQFSPRKTPSFNGGSNTNAFDDMLTKTPPQNKSHLSEETPQPKLKRKGSLKQRPTQKKNDDVEVEGQSLLLVEEEDINDEFKPLYAGHIVAVLDRIPGQLFTGTLGLLRPSQNNNNNESNNSQNGNPNNINKKPKIIWFKPTDKKVPLVAIPTEQAPEDFIDNPGKYTKYMYMASIKRWPITSLHPFGTLVGPVGEIENPQTNVECILKNNNFQSDEYLDPNDKKKERKNFNSLEIDETKNEFRPVYENPNICIINENENLGSDLSLSVEQIDNDRVKLSCHVIDISEHLESGSNLDKRIRKRSTGVFLPQRNVPLLPRKVENNCSFKIGSKSACISCHYVLNMKTQKIEESKIEESFVLPSYLVKSSELENFDPVYKNISDLVKRNRVSDFSGKIHDLPLLYKLDDENMKCDSLKYYFNSSNSIIDEIKMKVNNTVAKKIYTQLGDCAFLRKQSEPLSTTFYSFMLRVSEFPFLEDELNFESPIDCLQSITKIEDQTLREVVELMFYKTMNRAKYCVAGKTDEDVMENFLLNYSLYTHFTSPFKRYADHVVHRQLKICLKMEKGELTLEEADKNVTEVESLKITAEYCNFKKDFAFAAQEQAIHLLVCETISDLTSNTSSKFDQILTLGRVVQVYESSFDVFIPEFGIEKRVHGDQLPLIKAEFDNNNKKLELFWSGSQDSAIYLPVDEKKPQSFRNSIKNKFKTASKNIADHELNLVSLPELSPEVKKKFESMGMQEPDLHILKELKKEFLQMKEFDPSTEAIDVFRKRTFTRVEDFNTPNNEIELAYVQEIKELNMVPILVRAEIGMALPCLSVRALNPFV